MPDANDEVSALDGRADRRRPMVSPSGVHGPCCGVEAGRIVRKNEM